MTTDEMKLALLWHLRWKMQYSIVVTECPIGGSVADVLGIRKIVTEIEVKRNLSEVRRDLKEKYWKHQRYLEPPDIPTTDYLKRRPNKFYFALPLCCFPHDERGITAIPDFPEIPARYGVIAVFHIYKCIIVRSAKYLTWEKQGEDWREVLMRRLSAENIDLRVKLKEICDKSPQTSRV